MLNSSEDKLPLTSLSQQQRTKRATKNNFPCQADVSRRPYVVRATGTDEAEQDDNDSPPARSVRFMNFRPVVVSFYWYEIFIPPEPAVIQRLETRERFFLFTIP